MASSPKDLANSVSDSSLLDRVSGEMNSSCQGLDVDQETLMGVMNEGDSPFDSSIESGRSSCVKRKRSEDAVVACPGGGPCTQAVSQPPSRNENADRVTPISGSPYLTVIGSNARSIARGSRMATHPMAHAGPSWRPTVITPQAGPSWRPAVITPQAGPSWRPAVITPQAGPSWRPTVTSPQAFADGVPKRLKLDYIACTIFKTLMEDLGYVRDINVKPSDSDSGKAILFRGYAEGVYNMYDRIDISNLSAIESADGATPKQIIVIEDAADAYEFNFIGQNDRLNSTFSYTSDLRVDETWVSEDSWALL